MKKIILLFMVAIAFAQNALAQKDTYPIPKDKIIVDTTGKKGGRLVLPFGNNPGTFNPITTNGAETEKVLKGMNFLNLVNYDRYHKKWEPLLVKGWEISEDGLVYTFTLREGLKWSDGTDFTIKDVILTYKIAFDENIPFSGRAGFEQFDGSYPEFKVLNQTQFQFTLKKPNALFLGNIFDTYIVPHHKWNKVYEDGKFAQAMDVQTPPEDLVSMGPYFIAKYVPDQRVVLKRNPYYFKFDKNGVRLPYFDKIIRISVPDKNTAFVKFLNRETMMHEIRPEEYDLAVREQEKGNFKIHDLGPSYLSYYFMLNQNTQIGKNGKPYLAPHKLKVFSDKRFRQAISYAIDRKGIVKNVFHGRAVPFVTSVSPGNKKWFNPNTKKYPLDLKKAKALLKEVGLKDSNNNGILEYENGDDIRLDVYTNSSNHSRIQIISMMKKDLKKIGIDLRLNAVPFNTLLTKSYDTHDYDAIVLGWSAGVPADPLQGKNMYLSTGRSHAWNPTQKNPATAWEKRMDELIGLVETTLDYETRKKYFDEIEKIWAEQSPQIMIAVVNLYVGISNNIGNAKPVIDRPFFDWNVEELYDKTLKDK